jgi:hypothetical protein
MPDRPALPPNPSRLEQALLLEQLPRPSAAPAGRAPHAPPGHEPHEVEQRQLKVPRENLVRVAGAQARPALLQEARELSVVVPQQPLLIPGRLEDLLGG